MVASLIRPPLAGSRLGRAPAAGSSSTASGASARYASNGPRARTLLTASSTTSLHLAPSLADTQLNVMRRWSMPMNSMKSWNTAKRRRAW